MQAGRLAFTFWQGCSASATLPPRLAFAAGEWHPRSLRRIALTLVIDLLQSLSSLYVTQPQERRRRTERLLFTPILIYMMSQRIPFLSGIYLLSER